jgi:CBS domain-containing protein
MRTAQDFMVEIPVLKETDQMTRARQILRDDRFREVYVVDAKKNLLGYIDITDGLRVTATKSNITIEGFIREAPRALPEDPIEQVAKAMRTYRTDSAPITDGRSHMLGGVLLADLFPVIISRNELHGPVSRRMSTGVVAAGPEDKLQKVSALIVESGFAAFPVLAKKKLVGLISRRDLISRRVRTMIAHPAGTTIADVMTREVFTIGADEPLSAAAELIVKHDVSLLPVMGDGHLVGVVNRHDIIGALA